MDEFSQSRADDDLFDDGFVPVEAVEEVDMVKYLDEQVHNLSLGDAPAEENSGTRNTELLAMSQASMDRSDSNNSRFNLQGSDAAKTSHRQAEAQRSGTPPVPSARPATPSRPPAVRGDRTATGGLKKPKLTEDELTAKLAAAKTRSKNISAAHARAEADAANFEERERAVAEKKIKEIANQKMMQGEREKNRARKMAVMGGREWDTLQPAEDEKRGGGVAAGRGGRIRTGHHVSHSAKFYDGVDEDLSQYQWDDRRDTVRGRGAGKRGRRGGRNAQRWHNPRTHRPATMPPNIAAEGEFPSLPASSSVADQHPAAVKARTTETTPAQAVSPLESSNWADQMEAVEGAKPVGGW